MRIGLRELIPWDCVMTGETPLPAMLVLPA